MTNSQQFFINTLFLCGVVLMCGVVLNLCYGVKYGKNPDYLSKKQTTAIKGIFVLLVFFGHITQYITMGSAYERIVTSIGQLVVVMFLFYSGYGIMCQIMTKNDMGGYIKGFLKRRLLPIWQQFAFCVMLYLLLAVAMGKAQEYSIAQILLAFTGWTSIGNSNWFMFDTFILYLLIYVSFAHLDDKKTILNGLIVFSLLASVFAVTLYCLKEPYWWNTVLSFPLGMWYGYYKEKIDQFLFNNNRRYYLITAAAIVAFLFIRYSLIRRGYTAWYVLYAMIFALIVVFATMRVRIGNRVLAFLGSHIFSIYILQRLPMIFFQGKIENRYIYFIICFVVTMLLAFVFDLLVKRITVRRLKRTTSNQ